MFLMDLAIIIIVRTSFKCGRVLDFSSLRFESMSWMSKFINSRDLLQEASDKLAFIYKLVRT